jgi:hypothetical protein
MLERQGSQAQNRLQECRYLSLFTRTAFADNP